MTKKINIVLGVLVLVLFAAAAFFGYKSNSQANTDATCSYNVITRQTLQEKVETSCSNIAWGKWSAVENGKQKRVGSGTMNIVNYSKVDQGVQRKTRRGLAGRIGCGGIRDQIINKGVAQRIGLSKNADASFKITKTPYVCSVRQTKNVVDGAEIKNDVNGDVSGENGDSVFVTSETLTGERAGEETIINAGDIVRAPQSIRQNLTCSTDNKKYFDCESKVIKLLDINTPFYIKTSISESCIADPTSIPSFSNIGGSSYFTYEKVEKGGGLDFVATVKSATKNGGRVITQEVESLYCLGLSGISKPVKVKVVNLKVKEI